jgi:hypothetical protein
VGEIGVRFEPHGIVEEQPEIREGGGEWKVRAERPAAAGRREQKETKETKWGEKVG